LFYSKGEINLDIYLYHAKVIWAGILHPDY